MVAQRGIDDALVNLFIFLKPTAAFCVPTQVGGSNRFVSESIG